MNDPCDRYPCFNNGTCSVDLINDQKVPTCDCPENTDGQTCNLLICGSNEKPCYNGGTCTSNIVINPQEPSLPISSECQCQENGKYHGKYCEMPGRDACGGSPCQNGGTCTLIDQGEIQACFLKNIKKFYKSKIMLKL